MRVWCIQHLQIIKIRLIQIRADSNQRHTSSFSSSSFIHHPPYPRPIHPPMWASHSVNKPSSPHLSLPNGAYPHTSFPGQGSRQRLGHSEDRTHPQESRTPQGKERFRRHRFLNPTRKANRRLRTTIQRKRWSNPPTRADSRQEHLREWKR